MSEQNCEPVQIVVIGISHQEAPNFDFSCKKGLHTCWHMHKRKERGNVRIALILSAIEARAMAPNFTPDGQQIMIWTKYLEGARS